MTPEKLVENLGETTGEVDDSDEAEDQFSVHLTVRVNKKSITQKNKTYLIPSCAKESLHFQDEHSETKRVQYFRFLYNIILKHVKSSFDIYSDFLITLLISILRYLYPMNSEKSITQMQEDVTQTNLFAWHNPRRRRSFRHTSGIGT